VLDLQFPKIPKVENRLFFTVKVTPTQFAALAAIPLPRAD